MATKRYGTTEKQLEILRVMYRFRFITTDLLARVQGRKNAANAYPRLTTLVEQGMIARHYDPSDKMMGKYAAYYLLPEGVKALRKKDRLSPAVVKHIGKDAKATEHQINRFLNVAKVYCDLRDAYGDKVEVRTASDLAGSGPRINQLPDALVKLRTESGIASFYLAVHNSTVSVKETSRKLSQYSKDDLEDFLGVNGFSGVLSICETSQLQRQIENRNNLFSFEFLVTSLESLLRIKENDSIWHRPGKSERAVSLASL